MAQSTGGTSLVANYAASSRVAAREVLVRWNGVDWIDETARVLECDVNHALFNAQLGLPMLGMGIPSEAMLTLDNFDSRCCVSKTGSIANTNCPDGIYRVPIRINMGYSAETLRQFTGEIIEAPGTESVGRRVVTFRCMDYAYALRQLKHVTGVSTDQRVDQFMETLLTAADAADSAFNAYATRALDVGVSVLPMVWSDEENLWEQLGLLAAGEAGLIHFSKEAEFRFWRATAFLERADSVASQVTLDRAKSFELSDALSWQNAYTQVNVEANPWLRGPLTDVYRAQAEILVPPNTTVTHWARFNHVATSVVAPVANSDYYAVSAGMADLSANLEIATTAYAQQAKLDLTNNHASQAIYVLNLRLRGYPLVGYGDDKIEYPTNLDPVKIPGKKELTIAGNHYLQTRLQAEQIGTRLRDLTQRPRRLIGWRGPLCPWLEVGDRVTVVDAEHGLNQDMLVMVLSIRSSLATMDMEVILLPVSDLYPYTNYFVWGSSAYANSGSLRAFY